MTVRNILNKIEEMDGVLNRAVLKEADDSQRNHDCYIISISDMITVRYIFNEYKSLLLDLEIKEGE